jgi:voltage-dependent anion channel protein 2
MATKFADIGKGAKDLLNDDYTTKISLKCKKAAGPVAVTIETEQGSGGALSSKVGTKFSAYGLSFDKAQMKADGGLVLETSMAHSSGVKLAFKGNKGADVCVDYKNGNIYATGVLDVKDMSRFSTSACLGIGSGMMVGGNMTYGLSGKTGVTGLNVGGAYASGPLSAALNIAPKASSLNCDILYKVNKDLSIASSTVHSKDKPLDVLAVGGAYHICSVGTLKAKIGSNGILSASLVGEVVPKVTVTGSASVSTSGENFKYGLGIVM